MIRPGFLDIELRQNLIELARDGSAAHRLARRANALVLLDDGMSCEAIAKVLLLDDDTIRTWYRLYEEDGIEGLTNFSYEGSACQLSGEQQEKLKAWVATALPRTTRQVGAWIEGIEADRSLKIGGVEVDEIIRACAGDMRQSCFGQVAMRIEES